MRTAEGFSVPSTGYIIASSSASASVHVTDWLTCGPGDIPLKITWLTNKMLPSAAAKCNSVRKPHAILPDTPGDLTSASKYFHTLPDHPGDKQSALRLCKSIPRCSWKHLQLWRCIQEDPSRIVKFRSSWDLCADLRKTSREGETAVQLCGVLRVGPRPLRSSAGAMIQYSHNSGSYISTRHFVLSYSSLLQSQDSLHHTMACII